MDFIHAVTSSYATECNTAIRSDLSSLHARGALRMATLPMGRNAIGEKWVFKVKSHLENSVDRSEARMVAHSFSQS
jgi:hypothetical protein